MLQVHFGDKVMMLRPFFKERPDALRTEGRYRVFADIERRCSRFPRAFDHRIGDEARSGLLGDAG
jgi:5-aminolevulinate synthase